MQGRNEREERSGNKIGEQSGREEKRRQERKHDVRLGCCCCCYSSSSARRYSPQSAWWKTTMALGSAARHSDVDLAVTPNPSGTSVEQGDRGRTR